METADVVVVGLGAMGSAATYQLAKRGAKTVGIDRFAPPHVEGSTHGESRITRLAVGEGLHFIPLVRRSHEIWREIEAETGQDLLTTCGGLVISAAGGRDMHGVNDFFLSTVNAAAAFSVEHEILSVEESRSRFPQCGVADGSRVYYEPGAGFVRPEPAVAAQIELARRHGASIRLDEPVLDIGSLGDGTVVIHTGRETFQAATAVIAAGPWIGDLVGGDIGEVWTVYDQTLHWFDASARFTDLTPEHMPIFIWEFGSGPGDMFYGFPAVNGPNGGLKVATEQFAATSEPGAAGREVPAGESETMYQQCVKGRLPIGPAVVRTAKCFYTVTPDFGFIVDRHPDHENIYLVSPCSGHGFKHSPAIGEGVAQWIVEGAPKIDFSPFSLARF